MNLIHLLFGVILLIFGTNAAPALFFPSTNSVNPGYEVRITDSGMAYASEMVGKVVSQLISKISLPPIGFTRKHLDLTLTNTQISQFSDAKWSYGLTAPNLVSMKMNGAKLVANSPMIGKILLSKAHGNMMVTADNTDLMITIRLTEDKTGKPVIYVTDCSVNIENLDVRMHGTPLVNIINWFHKLISRKVKPVLIDGICQKGKTKINSLIETFLANISSSIPIGKKGQFSIEYELTKTPEVTAEFVDISGKGQILYNNTSYYPYKPPPLDNANVSNSKMAYFFATDYILNTAAYETQKAGILGVLVNKDTFPSAKSILATTCPTLCIGTLIKEIGQTYPNTYTSMDLQSTIAPIIEISNAEISLDAKMSLAIGVDTPQGSLQLATANANITGDIEPEIVGRNLTGTVHITQLNFVQTSSMLSDPINWVFISNYAKYIITEDVNKLLANGIPIPAFDGVELIKPALTLRSHTLELATDVFYNYTQPN